MIAAWMIQVLDLGVTGILGCFLFWMLGDREIRDGVFGVRGHLGVVSVRRRLLRDDGGEVGSGAAARLSRHARGRTQLPAPAAGSHHLQFPADLIVPSGIARVVIMAAIAMGLVDAFGLGKGSNIGRGACSSSLSIRRRSSTRW